MTDGFTAVWRVSGAGLGVIIAGMESKAGRIVAKAAHDIEAMAKSLAPVDTGYLRNSIQATQLQSYSWRVTVGADYGLYVEWGTVHMAARPYLGPSVAHVRPSFLDAMRSVVLP